MIRYVKYLRGLLFKAKSKKREKFIGDEFRTMSALNVHANTLGSDEGSPGIFGISYSLEYFERKFYVLLKRVLITLNHF